MVYWTKRIIRRILVQLCSPFMVLKRKKMFNDQIIEGINNIPVFLISYNRLSYIRQMIEQLEKYNFNNIYIIDNCSTYEPLLDYYKMCGHKVFYMKENCGHMVFWKSNTFSKYRKNFYIVSDPDLEILDSCPDNFIEFMFNTLYKYPDARKVGFSLKIDDLDNNDLSADVVNWEKQYYQNYKSKDNIYKADIDTTFAIYLPDQLVSFHSYYEAYRTGYPYQAKHLPWYITKNNLTEEDMYYFGRKANGWYDPINGFMSDKERAIKQFKIEN